MSTSLGIGRPSAGKGRASHPRQPSASLYDSFEPGQLQGFKECFNMIDQDGDGLINESDLVQMLQQLGQNASTAAVASYFTGSGASRTINFTTFLTMFSDRLLSMDPEDELLEAFACFDEHDTGYVPVATMRGFLADMGDRMSQQDINKFLSPPFVDKHGNFAYREFLKVLRVTDLDQQEKAKASAASDAA